MSGRRAKGALWLALGFLLIAAALGLAVYNLVSDSQAGDAAEQLTDSLRVDEVDYVAGQPISPDTPMPVEKIDGRLYVGVLRLPTLGLELPVLGEWSYAGLRVASCRYSGSAYADDMVIAAHNYSAHFGHLGDLSLGDKVSFVDVRGNAFVYEVAAVEMLDPYAVAEMVDSGYDLSLFTCTFGGANRVTVRCDELLI